MNSQIKQKIRKMIMQEITKMVGEDAIIKQNGKDDYRNTGYNPNARSPHNLTLTKYSDSYDDFGGADTMCEKCGGAILEDDCMECGYSKSSTGMLQEGGCGCGGSVDEDDDGSDYSIDSMMANHPLGDYSNLNNTNITPNQAFNAGYEVSDFDDEVYGVSATSMHIDFPHHGEVQKHKHNNYMAKPSLYKVAIYSQKLLQMIPDGYELDDWQRTKIAQLSDDISEVYHSLDYDFYDDEI